MEPNMKGTVPTTMDIASHLSSVAMKAHEEFDAAKEYINAAIAHKSVDRALADDFYNMSTQETQHGEILVKHIDAKMNELKESNDPCFAGANGFWSGLKEQMTGYAAWIRQMQAQYKK